MLWLCAILKAVQFPDLNLFPSAQAMRAFFRFWKRSGGSICWWHSQMLRQTTQSWRLTSLLHLQAFRYCFMFLRSFPNTSVNIQSSGIIAWTAWSRETDFFSLVIMWDMIMYLFKVWNSPNEMYWSYWALSFYRVYPICLSFFYFMHITACKLLIPQCVHPHHDRFLCKRPYNLKPLQILYT